MKHTKEIHNDQFAVLYHNLVDTIPMGYTLCKIVFDENQKPIDFITLEVNELYEQYTGLQKDEILGKPLKSVKPDADEAMIQLYCEVAISGVSKSFEYFSKTFKRHFSVTLASPKKNYFTSIFKDITNEKTAEKIQKESENIFKTLFEEGHTIKLIIDYDTRKIVNANKVACDFYGYTYEELTNLCVCDINMLPKEEVKREMNKAKLGKKKYFNFKHRLKNGELRDVENYTSTITINNKLHLYSIIHDVTDRKLLEQEFIEAKNRAEKSETKYKAAFYTSPDAVNITRFNGEYVEVNEGFTRLTGYTQEDVVGKISTDLEIWHIPEDRQKLVDELQKNGFIENLESVFKGKNGQLIPALMSAKIITLNDENVILSVTRDITALKEAEKELLEEKNKLAKSEEIFRKAIITSHDSITINNIETGEYIIANEGYYEIFGYKKEEVIGQSALTLGIWYDLKEREKYVEILNQKGYLENFEAKFIKKNGRIISCLVSSSIMVLDGVEYTINITKDIDYLKKIERELIVAKEKAEESNQLKTAFLQNLSHEIRTPLNAISGFSGILNKPGLSEQKRKSYATIIQNSSDQLVTIVSDILTISALETRQEKTSISKVNINSIIIELLAIFKQQSSNERISIFTKQALPDEEALVYTDKGKITQILSNLLSNALKFTLEGAIEFGYSLQGKHLIFYVKDSGIGIKKEQQEKIFERFQQAHISISEKYGGTGLGLAICKGFANLLGGQIWVESEINEGATFFVSIPYKPVHKKTKKQLSTNNVMNKPIILVAEDIDFNYVYLEEVLTHEGYSILHAKDGIETLEVFKNNPNVAVILMDIKMPNMNGYDVAKKIKETNPSLPIIAQTAYALEHERKTYEDVFDAYLTKPIKDEELVATVKKLLK